MTRWYQSGWNHAIASAAADPELCPMTPRSSGSFVKVTCAVFSASGSTSCSMNSAYFPDTMSYSRLRSLGRPSPPLAMKTPAIIGRRFWAMRLSITTISCDWITASARPSWSIISGTLVPGT